MSSFVPAGEILGPETPVRHITIADDPILPSGEYEFVDFYCTDKNCDCRKTIIQIFHRNKIVSIVSFGWEKPAFYLRWQKSMKDLQLAKEMSGLSIDFSSPDRVSPQGILSLMNHLLDEKWIGILKDNYRRIRQIEKPDNVIRLPEKITRNAPCPCGSGKKHKHCCL